MEFGWNWLENFLNLCIDVNSCINCHTLLNRFSKALKLEESINDRLKNETESCLSRIRHVNHLEVAHKARSKRRSTTAGGCRCTNNCEVVNLEPFESQAVVETAMVDKLPQKFDGRLRAKHFYRGHINVIYVNESLCVALRPENALFLFVQLAFNR